MLEGPCFEGQDRCFLLGEVWKIAETFETLLTFIKNMKIYGENFRKRKLFTKIFVFLRAMGKLITYPLAIPGVRGGRSSPED